MTTEESKQKEKVVGGNSAFTRKQMDELAGMAEKLHRVAARNLEKERIIRQIESGSETSLRELSENYYEISGIYRQIILYYTNMLTYDHIVTPYLGGGSDKNSEEVVRQGYEESLKFIGELNVKQQFHHMVFHILRDGVYYGFLRQGSTGQWFIQDLPAEFCRSRFKTLEGLNTVEFDVRIFDRVHDIEEKIFFLKQFPSVIQKAYQQYQEGKTSSSWVLLPTEFGVCFYYIEPKPVFINVIPELATLEDYRALEKQRAKNENSYLLTHKLPTNRDGELAVELEEGMDLHYGIVRMLKDMESIHALTSFSDVEVHGLHSSRQGVRDELEKAERSVFLEGGTNRSLFVGESNTAIRQANKANETVVLNMLPQFNTWLSYQANIRFALGRDFLLLVSLLPITHYNRDTMVKQYTQNATYGYSKILPAVASGMSQQEMMGLMYLENDLLKLDEKLIPLHSAHTAAATSGQGGRPPKADDEKEDKTLVNEDAK